MWASTVIDRHCVGLYRDDGLAAINNANCSKLVRIRKDIIALFKEEGFSVTIKTNLIETNFLNVILNIMTEKYFIFEKPTIHHSTSTSFLTTSLQSSNSCLKWLTGDFKIYPAIRESSKVKSGYETALKDSGHFWSISFSNSNTQKTWKLETGKSNCSTQHIGKMWKQIMVNCSSSLWGSISTRIINA